MRFTIKNSVVQTVQNGVEDVRKNEDNKVAERKSKKKLFLASAAELLLQQNNRARIRNYNWNYLIN
jgi:hypothetical protein